MTFLKLVLPAAAQMGTLFNPRSQVAHFGTKLAVSSSRAHRKDAKALIANAVNHQLRDLGFWIFSSEPLDVACDLLFMAL